MDVSDVLSASAKDPLTRELYLHQFIDQIRSATMSERLSSISTRKVCNDCWAVVVAAAIESICLEFHEPIPSWTAVTSDSPIFIPEVDENSRGAAYLKSVSPEPFRRRNVFVPDNYLSRA
jgi:hypothetical protein